MSQEAYEANGKTIAEAIENALNDLGLERDDVSVEVLERPKTGFLGIGATGAKVRITYESTETQRISVTKITAEKPLEAPREKAPKEMPKHAEPQPAVKIKTAVLNCDKAEDHAKAPVKAAVSGVSIDPIDFLKGMFNYLQIEATAEIVYTEDNLIKIVLSGTDMGKVIGRHGETLDALQYITTLACNRGREEHTRIILDTENYREKREETLEKLARRLADNAIRYQKPVTLEPMSPSERRIIHTELQNNTAVTTYSTGADPGRRVVICPVGIAREGDAHNTRDARSRRYRDNKPTSAIKTNDQGNDRNI